MATEKYTYINKDSQPIIASEPVVDYAPSTTPNRIVLNIPEGIDAEPLREKVNAYYETLLQECIVEQEFEYHYKNWILETGPLSNTYAIAGNEHFCEIVKMGKKVVPFIVEKMKTDRSLIYLALEQIFHERLVKPHPVEGNPMMCSWSPSENTRLWIEKLS